MKKYLKFIAFFSGFTEKELDAFSRIAEVVTTKDNQFVVRENEEGKGLFFIVEGVFYVLKEIGDKKYKRLGKLRSGEFFGEMSLLTNEKNSASVLSKGEGILIFLSRDAFEELVKNNIWLTYEIMKKLATILSERLQRMNMKYGMAVAQLQSQ